MSKQSLEARVKALEDKMIIPKLPSFWLFLGTEERDIGGRLEHEDDETFRKRFVAEGGMIEEIRLFHNTIRYSREHPEGVDIISPDRPPIATE